MFDIEEIISEIRYISANIQKYKTTPLFGLVFHPETFQMLAKELSKNMPINTNSYLESSNFYWLGIRLFTSLKVDKDSFKPIYNIEEFEELNNV